MLSAEATGHTPRWCQFVLVKVIFKANRERAHRRGGGEPADRATFDIPTATSDQTGARTATALHILTPQKR